MTADHLHAAAPARRRSFLALCWMSTVATALVGGVLAGRTSVGVLSWGSPSALLWTAAPAAVLCAAGGAVVVLVGFKQSAAEVSFLGATVTTSALMALVHVVTSQSPAVPGSVSFHVSGALVLPVAMAAAAPLLAPRSRWAHLAAVHHLSWSLTWVGLTVVVGVYLLAGSPRSLAALSPTSVVVPAAVVASAAALLVSFRQLRLYEISRRPAAAVASAAVAEMGVAGLTRLLAPAYSPLSWTLTALDVTASLLLVTALAAGYRNSGGIRAILAPVLARDPLRAMELGFTPLVHEYVAALEAKDTVTRDHVVRVAELALCAGERLGLPPNRLRWLGIGALLHDIGKLAIPDEILNKPTALTDDEMAVMRTHARLGGDLLAATPSLAPAAWIVRGHHERFDGTGYPDRLVGHQLPIEAAIVSASDAYDAMANTRQYRAGLGRTEAVSVLSRLSGSQWNPAAVDAVIAALPDLDAEPAFDRVGERPAAGATSCHQDWFPVGAVPAESDA